MCLAVPMRIEEIRPDGGGVAAINGVRQPVELMLVDAPRVGEYVIVHAGFAIEKLDPAEADARLRLFEELARHHRGEGDGSL